ncbi:transposase [Mesorhizobium humile]|uniref:transposase n=1 Tax=Mesorhizobium humile TaxID=3072313 RepID=UPI003D3201D7
MIEAVAERLEGAPRRLRRRWSNEFKAQEVAEALEPGASVSAIAHRIGISSLPALRLAS